MEILNFMPVSAILESRKTFYCRNGAFTAHEGGTDDKEYPPPRKISRRTFLKAGAFSAAVMACAGALSACWVPAGGNGDIVVTERKIIIDGVNYTMDASLIEGLHFSLTVSGEGAPTFTEDDKNKFKMSVYHKATDEYYCKDLTPSLWNYNKGWCRGDILYFDDNKFWDEKLYDVGDVITVKYELTPGKNIIWKIPLESTATTSAR